MLDLAFAPERRGPLPIHRQLADHLRELIASGRLARGEKLPATRELAQALGVSRNTAGRAYEALVEDGALVAHVGQGTFVSSRGAALAPAPRAPAPARAFTWDMLFSRAARAPLPGGIRPAASSGIRFDFRGGRVDADALPISLLRRAWGRAVGEQLRTRANDIDPFGHPPLRSAIARALVSRGIRCESDDLLVTCGAQQALDLSCRVLIDPGDAVAVEQPGYFGAAMSFRAGGAELVGVDVDHEGLRTDALARALRSRRIKLIYTTPAAQMPTGVVMREARRRALLELADETQTPILEDDYDSEFRYGDPPVPALKTLDPAGQVIYVGTFSKALFPGLRIGYVMAARPLLARLAVARFTASSGADLIAQLALCELLESGAFESHVRRLRRRYRERRDALLAALATSMPEGTGIGRPEGGLMVWLSLPAGVDEAELELAARAEGVVYLRGRSCFLDGDGRGRIGLSFASHSLAEIAEGVARLGQLARRSRNQSPGRRRQERRST